MLPYMHMAHLTSKHTPVVYIPSYVTTTVCCTKLPPIYSDSESEVYTNYCYEKWCIVAI